MIRNQVIGISGAGGFIGSHLSDWLSRKPGLTVLSFSREMLDSPDLGNLLSSCDTFIHLAGMNRGEEKELFETNVSLARRLRGGLLETAGKPHVIFVSSVHRDSDSAYGRSKREGEGILREWADASGAPLSILVVPNVFGPGCKPFHHSVVATFCYQLANGEQATVLEDRELELIEIERLTNKIAECICDPPGGVVECRVEGSGRIKTGELLQMLEGFRENFFETEVVPDLADPFGSAIYRTFLSYIEPERHLHRPKLKGDERGQLFEIIRLANGGQILFSTTKPGVIRGDHFHRRKLEWFCVVQGSAIIRMRKVGDTEVHEFPVTGEAPEFVSIPPLYTHHLENVGQEDLLTMFWCNEIFDESDPDTYYERVKSPEQST